MSTSLFENSSDPQVIVKVVFVCFFFYFQCLMWQSCFFSMSKVMDGLFLNPCFQFKVKTEKLDVKCFSISCHFIWKSGFDSFDNNHEPVGQNKNHMTDLASVHSVMIHHSSYLVADFDLSVGVPLPRMTSKIICRKNLLNGIIHRELHDVTLA